MTVGLVQHAGVKWPRFPYPGLRPFRITPDSDESVIFYGRTRNKDDVLERLNASQFVSVVGPSGCGKSSLVKVGVIPALEAGLLTQAGYDWVTRQMRPGQDPLGNLAAAFADLCDPAVGLSVEGMTALLQAERSALWVLMDQLAPVLLSDGAASARPRCLLLLLDQFEEIFSGVQEQRAVDQFVGLMTQFFRRPHPNLYIILTMRTDFIGQCANFPGLAEILNKTQYITPVLRGNDLREAIERPALDYWGEVEPALVTEIMKDMGAGSSYDADHLPLMQHALLWLWQQAWPRTGATEAPDPGSDGAETRPRVILTLEEYRAHGRISGILNRHADEIYGHVVEHGEQQARITEIMFRRLSERDASRRYKRAPALMSEICDLARCDPAELQRVTEAFAVVDASFVELRPGRPNDPQLDLSHESLIRQWKRLRDWADREADMLAGFRKIAGEAETWEEQRKSGAFLKTGGQLAVEQQWWQDNQPTSVWAKRYSIIEGKPGQFSSIFPLVEEFLAASLRARSKARRRKIGGSALAIAVLVAVVWGVQQDHLRTVTETLNQTHRTAAVLWGDRELVHGRASTTLLVTRAFLDRPGDYAKLPEIEALAYRALEQLREARFTQVGQVLWPSYSPDGRWLIAATNDRPLCFWDTGNDRCVTPLPALPSSWAYFSVRLNPQGDRLLVVGQPPRLVPVDLSGPVPRIDLAQAITIGNNVPGVGGPGAFSPDGKRIATGGNGIPFRIWDGYTGGLLAEQRESGYGSRWNLALNADSTLLAAPSSKGGVDIYHVEDRLIKGPFPVPMPNSNPRAEGAEDTDASTTRVLVFHPKDPNLLLFNLGRRVFVVNVATPEKLLQLTGHGKPATQAAFNRDGTMIATADDDGAVRVWSYRPGETGRRPADLVPIFGEHDGPVVGVSFSPDDQHIASTGRDQTLRIWTIKPALRPDTEEAATGDAPSPPADDSKADNSGTLPIHDSHGASVTLKGLPAGFAAAAEADTQDWIAVAPKRASTYPGAPGKEALHDVVLFRRSDLESPMALLDAVPADWISLEIRSDGPDGGHVIGHTGDGHQYVWRYLADRGGLSKYIGEHLPKGDRDLAASLTYVFCLVGLNVGMSIEQCLPDAPAPVPTAR